LTDSQNKAKKYAFKLLSYRGRSEKELKERLLKKGISKAVTSSTVTYLKHLGLIDDRSLAETLKREALSRKLLSQKGASLFLHHRGVPREIIDEVLDYDETVDLRNARRLLHKKNIQANRNYSSLKVKRRLYSLLARRGYSSDTIHKVLKEKILHEEDL
jgi:regulatory protein